MPHGKNCFDCNIRVNIATIRLGGVPEISNNSLGRFDHYQAHEDYLAEPGLTLNEIAEKYDVNASGLRRRASREGWWQDRKAARKARKELPTEEVQEVQTERDRKSVV